MKPKTLMLLAVAGGCGLVAMLAVQQAMQASNGPEVETKNVLVVLEAVETGQMLTEDRVAFQARPVDNIPEDAVTSAEEYALRGARVPLFVGDVVTTSKLTEPGGVGNSMKIPKGMRVITVPVNETNNHSNLVSPGDRVDVIVTYQARTRGPAQTKTKTLLEYVEVFATGAVTQDRASGGNAESMRTNHVSLLLMPEQVNYVKLAESKGSLSLAWRHRLDDEFVQIKDIDEQLLEELEGTMGINERRDFDLFGGQYAFDVDDVKEPEIEVVNDPEPVKVEELLSVVEEANESQPVAEPTPEPAVVETKPTWTIEVYNGNTSEAFQFEVEGESTEEDESSKTSSLADTVRSLWAGIDSNADADATSPEAVTTN